MLLIFTVISPQLINPYIETNPINNKAGSPNTANNRSIGIRNSVVSGIIGGTTYSPGSPIEIGGFLDYMQQYYSTIDPTFATNKYQFVPAQSNVSIYLQNPNNPSYKLNIVGGSHQTTTGVDSNSPYGVDDNLYNQFGVTYLTSTNPTQASVITSIQQNGNVGYFDIIANIPSSTILSALGIVYGSVNVYVVFGGNSTSSPYSPLLPSWNIATYSIILTNQANLQASAPPAYTTIVPNAPRNSSTFTLTLTDGGSGLPIPSKNLNYNVYNNNTDPNHLSPICSGDTNTSSNCASANIYITSFPSTTDTNGRMTFTVGLISWNSINTIMHYAFKIFANYNGSQLYGNSPAVLENFTFQLQQGNLQIQSKNPNTNMFRPGENVILTLQSYTNVTGLAFPNVPINAPTLYYQNNNTQIANTTKGFTILYGTKMTNTNGLLNVIIQTLGTTVPGIYSLKMQAVYSSFVGAPNYIINNLTSSVVWYNFSIDNMYDNFGLTFYSALPQNTTTIVPQPGSGSVTQIVLKASILYNSSWLSYQTNHPASADGSNIPINASLSTPGSNLTISIANSTNNPLYSKGYYLTNSTGYIIFNITAIYPLTYVQILENLLITANLPGNNPDTFLRYYNAGSHTYTTTPSLTLPTTGSFSVDPQYTPINVILDSPATNTTFIRPGDAITLNFKAINTNTLAAVAGVPISFSISSTVTGLTLTNMSGNTLTTSSYLYTDVNGKISIILKSTYGVTIESITQIIINIIAKANITYFNQRMGTNQPSIYIRPYYTGMYHQGTDTFAHYSNTWSNVTNPVTLKAGYTVGVPQWQNLVKIRPGTSTNFTMTVVNNNTLLALTSIRFPVNVTATCYADSGLTQQFTSCASVGVSITIPDLNFNPAYNTTFYYTNSSNGMLKVHIQTTLRFSPNPIPKFIYIRLNATIDFLNKLSSTIPASSLRWYVGTTKIGSYNLSQGSLSVNNAQYSRGQVNQDPQYVNAAMVAVLPTAGQTVQPLNTITLQYRVSIINDTGLTEYLSNVNVTLNTTVLNKFNMTSLQPKNTTLTDSNGIATFNLEPTANTIDGSYYMPAIANLGANQTQIGASINSYWINGTIWKGGNNTYSIASTLNFTVKAIPTLSVSIIKVLNGNTVFSSSAPFLTRRGYTLELNITYKDSAGHPYNSSGPTTIYYNTSSNMIGINNTLIATLGQITNGVLYANVTLPVSSNIIVGPSIIWANDTSASTRPIFNGAQVEVITTTTFASITINTNNKNYLTTGDQITVSGILKDDLGNTITNTLYPANVLGELTNRLLVYGSATNNASAIGITSTTPNAATGVFTLTFTLPSGYTQSTLPIFINLKNDTAIVDFVHIPLQLIVVKTYQYLQALTLQLSGTGISYSTTSNNSNYNIDNNTNGYTLNIIVLDNFGRQISNFTFGSIFGTTPTPSSLTTNTNGQLLITGSPSEYVNSTLVPRNITLQYTNGTTNNIWELFIIRTVYDITPPSITIIYPLSPNNTAIYQNTPIEISLNDGNPTTTVTTGINISSLSITIKDNNNNVLSTNSVLINPGYTINGYIYLFTATINYAYFSTSVTSITMTIFARDNGIKSSTAIFVFTFDRSAPQFNLASITPSNKTYIAAYSNLSLIVTDNDRNGVNAVFAQVTINGITNVYQLTQTNATMHIWSTPRINFSVMAILNKNATVIFTASDTAGNTNTATIIYLADTLKPTITIVNYNTLANSVQFVPFSITVQASDYQSGINASSLVLNHGFVSSLINESTTSTNDIYAYTYVIRVTPNIYGLTNNQGFSIGIFDYAGNSNTVSMTIQADINPPVLNNIQVINKNNNYIYQYNQPASSTNTSFTETGVSLNSDHKLVLFYSDPGVISSGINTTGTTVDLWVFNKTSGNYEEILNLDNTGLNIQIIVGTGNLTIFWHSSSNDSRLIALSGQGGTGSFNIGIRWSINLKDNAGHTTLIQYDYIYQVYVPTILDFIVSIVTTAIIAVAIFGAVGIVLAVIYERIRFEK